MKKLAILGSTGSIGTQCLEVVSRFNDKFSVDVLTCNRSVDLIFEQAQKFKPKHIVVGDDKSYKKLCDMNLSYKANILMGVDGLKEAVSESASDVVVNAIVGSAGLIPTVNAIMAGKEIALANKETLVTAGEIIMPMLKEYNVNMIPVDSEHSGVFQIMQNAGERYIDKIILTASGGPFRGKSRDELLSVKAKQALKHPNWEMGRKISIDSATLMNKGLEVIEAHWLFDKPMDDIDVIVHKESIIHAMILYDDGCLMAQMGSADMRLPILYALTHPNRIVAKFKPLDLVQVGSLNFEKPDLNAFPSLELAYEAGKMGGIYPTVLNAANEILVDKYLSDKIGFYDIPDGVKKAMDKFGNSKTPSIDDILNADKEVRNWLKSEVNA